MTEPKKRLALIPVERCTDCPKHEMIHDPSSGDTFDIGDQSLCCTATPPPAGSPKTFFGRTYPGRVVVACERPGSSAFRRAEIPEWCPYLKK